MSYKIKNLHQIKTFILGFCFILLLAQAAIADPNFVLPSVIQKGFTMYISGGAEPAFAVWRQGGLLERDSRVTEQAERFKAVSKVLGIYRSHELVDVKEIGKTCRMIYLAISFEHGAMFARFLVYRAEKDWVVQYMDFNTRPEAIMPWLALERGSEMTNNQ